MRLCTLLSSGQQPFLPRSNMVINQTKEVFRKKYCVRLMWAWSSEGTNRTNSMSTFSTCLTLLKVFPDPAAVNGKVLELWLRLGYFRKIKKAKMPGWSERGGGVERKAGARTHRTFWSS